MFKPVYQYSIHDRPGVNSGWDEGTYETRGGKIDESRAGGPAHKYSVHKNDNRSIGTLDWTRHGGHIERQRDRVSKR